jgi:hypothetical protein
MPKISTYAIDASPSIGDKVIGTEVGNNNVTKNYTIGNILGLASFSVYGDTGVAQTIKNNDSLLLLGGVAIDSVASNTGTVTFSHLDYGTPGTYAYPVSISVNTQGHITGVTSGVAPGIMTSFDISGNTGANQTIYDDNTLSLVGGLGIDTAISAPGTATFTLDISELPISGLFSDADYFAVTSGINQHKIDPGDVPVTSFGAATNNLNMGTNKIISLVDPTVATDAATKGYVDATFAGSGALIFQGGYDATGAPPTGAGVLTGFTYSVTVAGNGGGFWSTALAVGDVIISNQNNPTSESQWTAVNNNVSLATAVVAGIASFPSAGGLSISSGAVSLDNQTSNGTFGDAANSATLAVNGKGVVIGASQNPIAITASQVTDFCNAVTLCATSVNLGNTNLTQSDSTRTYDVNSGAIQFQSGVTPLLGISSSKVSIGHTVPLQLLDAAGSEYVGFKAPTAVTSSYTLILPAAVGTAGQFLQTSAAGVLSWATSTPVNLGNANLIQTPGQNRTYSLGNQTMRFTGNTGNTIFSLDGISGNNSINTGLQVPIRFLDGNINYVGLQSPAIVSTSYTLTLPTADGTVGQVLKTDGAGQLAWVNPASTANLATAELTQTIGVRSYDINEGVLIFGNNGGTTPLFSLNSTPTNAISISNQATLRFELSVLNGLYAGIKAPSSLASSYTLTLPDTDGNANEVLQTDGSGILSWVSQSDSTNLATADLIQTGTDRSYTMTSNSQSLSFHSPSQNPVLKINANPSTIDVFGKIRLGRQLFGPIEYLTLSVDSTIESLGSYQIQFPGNTPTVNQQLSNLGSGYLAWTDPASKVNIGTFTGLPNQTGAEGDVVWTTDYIYVCIATDTWKRVALASW